MWMWATIQSIIGYVIGFIEDVFGNAATDKKIEADKADVAVRTAESKAELARLNELGVLKTTASNDAQVLTEKVAGDEQQVKVKAAEVDKAKVAVDTAKTAQRQGTTTSDLQKQLDDLDK